VSDGILTGPGGGERFDRGNRVVTLRGDLPQLSVNTIEFDASFEVPPHRHDDQVDSFYVLEGEVVFTLGEETVRAGPGSFVSAPPGTVHGFRTDGPGRANVVNLHTPDAGFAGFVRDQ
jgi:quercetin dioxygenase-like cupin family protein